MKSKNLVIALLGMVIVIVLLAMASDNTEAATAISVTATPDPITQTNNLLTVEVQYDDLMNASTEPTVNLSAGDFGVQTLVGWTTNVFANDTYTCTFLHGGTEEELSLVMASLDPATAAWNSTDVPEVWSAVNDTFDIDSDLPMATSLTVSPSIIDENNLVLTVDVDYDEPMNLFSTPTIVLSGGNFGAQTSVGWVGNTYTCNFTHAGSVEYILGLNATLGAQTARDLADNTENTSTVNDTFDVRTGVQDIDTSPASYNFTVNIGDTDSANLTIDNVGGDALTYSLETGITGQFYSHKSTAALPTISNPNRNSGYRFEIRHDNTYITQLGKNIPGDGAAWVTLWDNVGTKLAQEFVQAGPGWQYKNITPIPTAKWDQYRVTVLTDTQYEESRWNGWFITGDLGFSNCFYADGDENSYPNNLVTWPMIWGMADVGYAITSPEDWLTISPDSGMLPPSTMTNHTVDIDTAIISPGTYQTNILAISDDPDEGLVEIPITLNALANDHDVRVLDISVPTTGFGETTINIGATISNQGLNNETNMMVLLKVNGIAEDSTIIPSLNMDSQTFVSLSWVPLIGGLLDVEVSVIAVPGETYIGNNMLNDTINITLRPDIDVIPTSFDFTALTGGTDTGTLTLDNTGLGVLDYDIAAGPIVAKPFDENTSDLASFSGFGGSYGYRFQAMSPGMAVTNLGAITPSSGTNTVELYDDVGTSLAQVSITRNADEWTWESITPVPLVQGDFYRVAIHASQYYQVSPMWSGDANINVTDGVYGSFFSFPSNTDNSLILGVVDITYSIVGGGWLTSVPDTGSIPALDFANHTITANASALSPGYYESTIDVLSNDHDEGYISIPVTFNVLSGADDVGVFSTVVPTTAVGNKPVMIDATIINTGTSNETNVEVELYINGSLEDSFMIGSLNSTEQTMVSLTWTPTAIGNYSVEVYAVPVGGETYLDNNWLNKTIDIFGEAEIWLNPTSIDISVTAGMMNSTNLTIGNDGLANLDYTVVPGVIKHPFEESDTSSLATFGFALNGGPRFEVLSPSLTVTQLGKSIPGDGAAWVTLWDDFGGQLAQVFVQAGPGWQWGDITPVPLTQGEFYRVTVNVGVTIYDTAPAWYAGNSDISVTGSYYAGGGDQNTFPTTQDGNIMGTADIGYLSPPPSWLSLFPDNGSVSPAGSSNCTITADATTLNAGTYTFEISVLSNDTDEGILIVPINLTVLPVLEDLAVTVTDIPAMRGGGHPLDILWTVENVGTNPHTNIDVELYINDTFLVDSTTIVSLGGGSSTDVTLSWTPLVAGTYNVSAYVTPVGGETLIWNNWLNTTIDITVEPEVWYSPGGFDFITTAGVLDSMNLTIYNVGIGNLTYSFSALPAWVTVSPISGTISAASNVDVMITVNASMTTPGIHLDDITLTTNDTDEGTLLIPVNLTAIYGNDTTVISSDLPVMRGGGYPLDIMATVENIGHYDQTNVEVQLYINGTLEDSVIIPSLLGYSQTDVTLTWSAMAAGNYSVEIYVAPVAGETSTTDNWLNDTIDITSEAEIWISPMYLDFTLIAGEMDSMDFTIGNVGVADLNFDIGGGLPTWLSTSPGMGTVSSGSSANVTVSTETSGLPPGFYQTTVSIASNDVDEPSLMVTVNLTIQPRDISVASIDAPATADVGDMVPINATIDNIGASNEMNISIVLEIDGTLEDTMIIPMLNMGTSTTVMFYWMPMMGGAHTIDVYAVLIPHETNTGNNNQSGMITILEPEISTDPTSHTLELLAGDGTTAVLTINNTGTGNLTYTLGGLPSWAMADTMGGMILPAGHVNITITMDTRMMVPGLYLGDITITSNDLDESTLVIPLSLTIQARDITVTDVTAPATAIGGTSVLVTATIDNTGMSDEVNITVVLEIDGTAMDSYMIDMLNSSDEMDVMLSWIPLTAGAHTINVYAMPAAYETDTADNNMTETITISLVSDVTVTPTSFVFTLEAGDTDTGDIMIGNMDLGDLTYTIAGLTPAWISASATSGTVMMSAYDTVTITLDATGLSADTYSTDLVITCNDPDMDMVTIPVSLHVMTSPTEPLAVAAVAGDGNVQLTWSAPTDDGDSPITEYHIYRGTAAAPTTLLTGVTTLTTYNDATTTNGETYYYRITAENDIGVSGYSLEINATPMAPVIVIDTDEDNDGLLDAWEIDNFGDLTYGAEDDPDDDGFTNAEEEGMQTNPMDPDSAPEEGGTPLWALLLIVLLVIIVLVLLLLVMKSRGGGGAPSSTEESGRGGIGEEK